MILLKFNKNLETEFFCDGHLGIFGHPFFFIFRRYPPAMGILFWAGILASVFFFIFRRYPPAMGIWASYSMAAGHLVFQKQKTSQLRPFRHILVNIFPFLGSSYNLKENNDAKLAQKLMSFSRAAYVSTCFSKQVQIR